MKQGSLLLGLVAGVASAQSASSFVISQSASGTVSHPSPVNAQTTMRLFVDAKPEEGFVGSIVAVESCDITIALACTEGYYGSGLMTTTCNPSATALATYGLQSFGLSTSAETLGGTAILSEACSLTGTTVAVCTASASVSVNGHHTASSTVVTKTGTDVNYFQIPITAGAQKLSSTTTCTATANAAAPTGAVDVYKVLVAPAAALLAGLGAFA